ncbi:2 iron, 2 sulfur cluster binding [Polyrhizophydium stewartii]|uniref:2 iron, 2 sulfur cluster binding n=1 Tax=Polyrhizophydium stewartii TaxID=2732419 RepID=A0ABR4NFU5_9FUNG
MRPNGPDRPFSERLAQPGPYGIELQAGKDYWFCSCGKSQSQPFCDGSHKGSGLAPIKFNVNETKKYWLCGCKVSSNRPFCDGTHSKEAGVRKYNEFLLKKNNELKAQVERAEHRSKLLSLAVVGAAVVGIGALVYQRLSA